MRLLIATLVLGAPLCAQTCDYTVQPASLSVPSGASKGQISVTTAAGCAWTVSNPNLSWLTLDTVLGTGSANITYTADANPTAVARTGSITVAARQINVTQAATACTYTLDSSSQNFGVGGGSGSFRVSSGCIWQPLSTRGDFIVVAPPNPVRNGNDTVNYTVAANGCVYGRSGSIVISSTSNTPVAPSFAITQDGSPANMSLSATSISAGPDASDGRVTVTTGLGCQWSATSDVTWMQIIGATGSGNGAVSYHLLANATAPRSGTLHIGNLAVTVTQAAAAAPVPTIAAIDDAANYRGDAVSPGEIVTLFGANMGPAKLVPLQVKDGYVANLLSTTQVLFDGVPAPLIYTLNTQVSAVVPYGVAGKSSTQVQVVYNGLTSAAVTMPVQASHPAIFTLDASGLGPGAILNPDYSINSSAKPAARGSVVAIYATGCGVTRPALADGAVTGSDLPYLTLPVAVTIGGIGARVTYAGGAPGAVAGLTQINAEIPDGVASGNGIPVVIKVGDYSSTNGVTLSVQ